ncbi:MAG: tetratricopeptide repeat protein [Flavobacteriales bacterium]|nr:tetratricopeptide repeat protein [Flavobacteriales bacterium]
MSKGSKKHWIMQAMLITASLAIFYVVYILPRTEPASKIREQQAEKAKEDIHQQIDQVKKELSGIDVARLNGFETMFSISQGSIKIQYLDSIIRFWDKQMRPAIAAIYAEDKAMLTQDKEDWLEAGNRYLQMASFLKGEDKQWAYTRGKTVFETILKSDPENADAKIGLGVCLVESGQGSPMEGIGLLRDVVDKDPTNTRAILQLGHFSVISGQFQKALDRYRQALAIDPKLDETYFFIGDTYAKMGETDSALIFLNKYKELQQEQAVKDQIDLYMQEIKIKSNNKN